MVFNIIRNVAFAATLLASASAWAQGAVSRQAASFAGVFASSGPNAYTMAAPTPLGWVNRPGFRVCGAFPATNTGPITVKIETAAALPVHAQQSTAEANLVSNEIAPNRMTCLTVNAAANAFLIDPMVGGGVMNDPLAPHLVTVAEWNANQLFVCTADCVFELPDATTLGNQGWIMVQTVAPGTTRLEPINAADGISGKPVGESQELPSEMTTVVTTTAQHGVHAFNTPLTGASAGEPGGTQIAPQTVSLIWHPGMDLATVPIPLAAPDDITVTNVTCLVGGPGTGVMNIDIYQAAEGVTADNVAAGTAQGVKMTSTPCNAAGPSGEQQAGLLDTNHAAVAPGEHVWAVATGAGWASVTGTSGKLQMLVRARITFSPTCTESDDFIKRTTGLDPVHLRAYDDLICGLKADGLLAGTRGLDALYIFATQNETIAELNLVSTNFPITKHGTPSFTPDDGYLPQAATDWLDTGMNPAIGGPHNFVQDSANMCFWSMTNVPTTPGGSMGIDSPVSNTSLTPKYTDNVSYFIVNSTSATVGSYNAGGGVPTTSGLFCVDRISNDHHYMFKNGAQLTVVSVAPSVPPANLPFYILQTNVNGTATGLSVLRIAAASIGAGLPAVDQPRLFARIRSYLTEIRNGIAPPQ